MPATSAVRSPILSCGIATSSTSRSRNGRNHTEGGGEDDQRADDGEAPSIGAEEPHDAAHVRLADDGIGRPLRRVVRLTLSQRRPGIEPNCACGGSVEVESDQRRPRPASARSARGPTRSSASRAPPRSARRSATCSRGNRTRRPARARSESNSRTGRTGTPARSAIFAAPRNHGPSLRTVPPGKMATASPCSTRRTPVSIAERSPRPRLTRNPPKASTAQPHGPPAP